jgi:hypothetical protein
MYLYIHQLCYLTKQTLCKSLLILYYQELFGTIYRLFNLKYLLIVILNSDLILKAKKNAGNGVST